VAADKLSARAAAMLDCLIAVAFSCFALFHFKYYKTWSSITKNQEHPYSAQNSSLKRKCTCKADMGA